MDEQQRSQRADRARAMITELRRADVRGIAVTWVDTSGLTRVKGVPLDRLPHAAAWGIGASPVFDTFLIDDTPVMGVFAGGPTGDLRLHPDLDRLVVLAAQPGWAWAPADRYDQDGAIYPLDAREQVRRAAAALAGDGYSASAAFEVEWAVSEGVSDNFVPACRGPAYGMTRLVELSDYLDELLVTLAEQGIAAEQIHPEYAAGQYELSVAAADPLEAADTLVCVRETIRAVSAGHGLRATFAPKVLADGVGNGGHVHLSLHRDGQNLMSGGPGRFGLTTDGEAFMAGIVRRLPALLALGAPSVASYLRLIPSHWAGAFACWGLENREAAVRFVTGARGDRDRAANFEVKCFDGAANPYLAVAALLAAGHAGVTEGATLPEPVDVDPASLDGAERERRGITALPTNLEQAVAAFVAEAALTRAFGKELVDTIATVRRGEIELLSDATPEEICARTRWKY